LNQAGSDASESRQIPIQQDFVAPNKQMAFSMRSTGMRETLSIANGILAKSHYSGDE
jgi:hypothetical protein